MNFIKAHKKLIVIVIVLVIVGAVGVSAAKKVKTAQEQNKSKENSSAVAVTVAPQDMSTVVNATGTVESQHVVAVTSDINSKCVKLNVALGDRVEKGQVLCVMDTDDVDTQIKAIESSTDLTTKQNALAIEKAMRDYGEALIDQTYNMYFQQKKADDAGQKMAEAQFALSQADKKNEDYQQYTEKWEKELKDARVAFEEAHKALMDEDIKNNRAIEKANDAIDTAKLATTANVETATNLAKLYRQKNSATIHAPQAGTVTSLNISEGGMPNGNLMTISDTGTLQVHVPIRERDILSLQVGLPAKVKTDAIPDTVFDGAVIRVVNFTAAGGNTATTASSGSSSGASSGSSSTGSGSSYSADITLPQPGNLLIGMTVKVEIIVNPNGSQLAVPTDAIVTEEDGSTSVLVAEKAEGEGAGEQYTLRKEKITIGGSNNYYSGIAEGNLKEGDMVIATPDKYKEGDVVTLLDVGEAVNDAINSDNNTK